MKPTKSRYRKAQPVTEARQHRMELLSEYGTIRDEVGRRYYGPGFKYTNLSMAERAMLDDLTMHTIQWRIDSV